MVKIFITGSADGLSLLTAKQLINDGHEVVLHARSQQRGERTVKAVADAQAV